MGSNIEIVRRILIGATGFNLDSGKIEIEIFAKQAMGLFEQFFITLWFFDQ